MRKNGIFIDSLNAVTRSSTYHWLTRSVLQISPNFGDPWREVQVHEIRCFEWHKKWKIMKKKVRMNKIISNFRNDQDFIEQSVIAINALFDHLNSQLLDIFWKLALQETWMYSYRTFWALQKSPFLSSWIIVALSFLRIFSALQTIRDTKLHKRLFTSFLSSTWRDSMAIIQDK